MSRITKECDYGEEEMQQQQRELAPKRALANHEEEGMKRETTSPSLKGCVLYTRRAGREVRGCRLSDGATISQTKAKKQIKRNVDNMTK